MILSDYNKEEGIGTINNNETIYSIDDDLLKISQLCPNNLDSEDNDGIFLRFSNIYQYTKMDEFYKKPLNPLFLKSGFISVLCSYLKLRNEKLKLFVLLLTNLWCKNMDKSNDILYDSELIYNFVHCLDSDDHIIMKNVLRGLYNLAYLEKNFIIDFKDDIIIYARRILSSDNDVLKMELLSLLSLAFDDDSTLLDEILDLISYHIPKLSFEAACFIYRLVSITDKSAYINIVFLEKLFLCFRLSYTETCLMTLRCVLLLTPLLEFELLSCAFKNLELNILQKLDYLCKQTISTDSHPVYAFATYLSLYMFEEMYIDGFFDQRIDDYYVIHYNNKLIFMDYVTHFVFLDRDFLISIEAFKRSFHIILDIIQLQKYQNMHNFLISLNIFIKNIISNNIKHCIDFIKSNNDFITYLSNLVADSNSGIALLAENIINNIINYNVC